MKALVCLSASFMISIWVGFLTDFPQFTKSVNNVMTIWGIMVSLVLFFVGLFYNITYFVDSTNKQDRR